MQDYTNIKTDFIKNESLIYIEIKDAIKSNIRPFAEITEDNEDDNWETDYYNLFVGAGFTPLTLENIWPATFENDGLTNDEWQNLTDHFYLLILEALVELGYLKTTKPNDFLLDLLGEPTIAAKQML